MMDIYSTTHIRTQFLQHEPYLHPIIEIVTVGLHNITVPDMLLYLVKYFN